MRMPKLAVAVLILALVALASSLTYAGFLVVGVVATHLGTGRFMAGLLLGILFARLPVVRNGKLRTVGLLPKNTRQPVMVALLVFCLLSYLYRGAMLPALFLGFAASFLLSYRWLRRSLLRRALASLFGAPPDQARRNGNDQTIIDAEFREKKD